MSGSFVLGNTDPIAFVPTIDPQRARTFYEKTLGLRMVSDELPFALVFDLNGIMLRLTAVQNLSPDPFTILGWKVREISLAAKTLQEQGVIFEHFSFLEQDELGVWTSPSGAKVAWFKDPDGNTLSISQH